MSTLGLLPLLALATAGPGPSAPTPPAAAADNATKPQATVHCKWECTCWRQNKYPCRRWYREDCAGGACHLCEARIRERARKSCSLGNPVQRCFCRGTATGIVEPEAAPRPRRHLSCGADGIKVCPHGRPTLRPLLYLPR